MAERKKTPPPDRNLKAPQTRCPPGACDTHFHIFGPQRRFPLSERRPMEIEDCTLEDLLALHDNLGISRGVIVQSVMHGHSYDYLMDALQRYPERFRGIAMPAPDITDGELEMLTAAGVVGIRCAFRFSPDVDVNFLHRLAEHGWHAQFWFRGPDEAAHWADVMRAAPGEIVIDHMGWQPAGDGIDAPGFRLVCELLDSGKAWVKLSGPNRFSAAPGLPYGDAAPFARKLVEIAPERLFWGSDWPHPDHWEAMPNDADLLDLLADWVPDETARNKILADNPAKFFGFG